MTAPSPGQSPNWQSWTRQIASPAVPFYALPWLMLLLVLGTYAQKDLGLYTAQKMFFSAWVFFLGPIPLPAGYSILAVISASLLVKFLFHSPWRRDKAGIIISHLGVLVLMIGGLLTGLTQQEGYILLGEGQRAKTQSDYHQRVVTVSKDGRDFLSLPFENLHTGEKIGGLPFTFSITDTCSNCRPVSAPADENRHGLAEQMKLIAAPPEKENEANLSGITFTVSGTNRQQDGTYVIMEEVPHAPTITHDKNIYRFSIGRAQRELPFTVELKNFRREFHPGTDTPRSFESDIVVHDGDIAWPYTIRMNEPLRYKGYTLYQSSFSVRPDGEYSILSVVTNSGRVFPYLASALVFAGLVVHLLLRLGARKS